jgi:hypothetical protein
MTTGDKDQIVSLTERLQQKQALREQLFDRLDKIGQILSTIIAPALQAMRELGLDNKQIAAILAHVADELRAE